MSTNRRRKVEIQPGKKVALYHCISPREGFEESAQALFHLIQNAQETAPGVERVLFLDIEGHRNAKGAFDADMFELQQNFIPSVLMPFLSEVHMPLAQVRRPDGSPQSNDVPPELIIRNPEEVAGN
jgi:hypothetical protein